MDRDRCAIILDCNTRVVRLIHIQKENDCARATFECIHVILNMVLAHVSNLSGRNVPVPPRSIDLVEPFLVDIDSSRCFRGCTRIAVNCNSYLLPRLVSKVFTNLIKGILRNVN
jgi:hypothetical protein